MKANYFHNLSAYVTFQSIHAKDNGDEHT